MSEDIAAQSDEEVHVPLLPLLEPEVGGEASQRDRTPRRNPVRPQHRAAAQRMPFGPSALVVNPMHFVRRLSLSGVGEMKNMDKM